jgi:hypothetical protein
MVYRAGTPGVDPEISMQVTTEGLTLQWQGSLQSAENLGGPWSDVADDSQSPMTVSPSEGPRMFFRASGD